jgi:hypothetical protein
VFEILDPLLARRKIEENPEFVGGRPVRIWSIDSVTAAPVMNHGALVGDAVTESNPVANRLG